MYPRVLPQVTRMTTGLTPDDPRFMARWEVLLRQVGAWLEDAAHRNKGDPG
jgi:hypothetical protein